jgi:hypothetical protein
VTCSRASFSILSAAGNSTSTVVLGTVGRSFIFYGSSWKVLEPVLHYLVSIDCNRRKNHRTDS